MLKTEVTLPIIVFATLLMIAGCDNSSEPTETTGTFNVSITDAPAAFDAVNITFSEVSVIPSDGQPIIVSDAVQTINLIEWSNGLSTPLGSIELEAGTYNQIRLIIDSASVVIDGVKSSVQVPSGAQTGLKLTHQFTLEAGSTYNLMIDFDASRSIVSTGPPANPSYLLKPTIRLVAVATTGSISGTVTTSGDVPVALSLMGTDTISTVFVDTLSGEFQLAFLEAGLYNVVVEDTTGARFDTTGVEVVAGADADLGAIELIK
ncbi:DUF4382 domain-containing protein [Candidatus Marinimicrobia bacterium MT.SAG.3]|nr:DUF4382 domain-containing protein [Candidatus Marinimicrobia bacterium MT.SAG.3]